MKNSFMTQVQLTNAKLYPLQGQTNEESILEDLRRRVYELNLSESSQSLEHNSAPR